MNNEIQRTQSLYHRPDTDRQKSFLFQVPEHPRIASSKLQVDIRQVTTSGSPPTLIRKPMVTLTISSTFSAVRRSRWFSLTYARGCLMTLRIAFFFGATFLLHSN